MCDDFFDDYDGLEDSMFDPNDDFEEDIADEYYLPEDQEFDEESANNLGDQDRIDQKFDILDAMIIGSMIAGNAYEEAEDEKKRRRSRK